jgi:hypothetical protein
VGLSTDYEDVDAIALTSDGRLLLSCSSSFIATNLSGADEDLIAFAPTSLGATTTGSLSMYFDGSDVGLSDNTNEDVDAAAVSGSPILLSTTGNFSVPGVSGADEDVVQFAPTSLGSVTSGTWSMHLDLSALGIAGSADVGALEWKE